MNNSLHISEIFSSIQGEGMLAGRRQIFVRLAGCNLRCAYCDTAYEETDICNIETTPGSNIYDGIPNPLSLADVLTLLSGWCNAIPGAHHSISITGGEPLLSADALGVCLPEMRKLLPIHLETNGTLAEGLDKIISHLDYVSMDIKLPSTACCGTSLWELHRVFLQKAQSANVSVKIIIGDSTSDEEVRQVCGIIAETAPLTPLFLQPLTLIGGHVGISAVHILRLQQVAALLLPDVRVIPQTHRLMGVL